MNTLRNNAGKTDACLKGVHPEKVDSIFQKLDRLRKELPDADKMKTDLDNSSLH